jgi:hypothetical protein
MDGGLRGAADGGHGRDQRSPPGRAPRNLRDVEGLRRRTPEHGESELLDEILSAKPQMDHARYRSAEELRDSGLRHLRDAVALLESKATAEERDDYRHFVLTLANEVAAAHREHGQKVSPVEAQAIQQITAVLGTTGS